MEHRQNFKVRDGEEGDTEKILSLRKIVMGEFEEDKLDPKFWKWEFAGGPDGDAFIYIIEEEKRIIGHFADIPRRFSVKGKTVKGTLSLDLMVHPDYWRRGFFFKMGTYAARKVKEENGRFMIAFPIREETIDGLKKIGWHAVNDLPVIDYPVRFHGIVNRYLHFLPLSILVGGMARFFYSFFFFGKGKRGTGIEIDEVKVLDDAFDLFWQKAASSHSILGVRDTSFLTWRYVRHPSRHYTLFGAKKNGEMRGYIVLRKVELLKFNSMIIVDLLALEDETVRALVEKGIEYSREKGTDLLGCILPKGHRYFRILRKRGFLPGFKSFLLMVYPTVDEKILIDPKEWYVNWGDSDVV